MTLILAETSVVKSRPSVPYEANLLQLELIQSHSPGQYSPYTERTSEFLDTSDEG